MRRIVRGGLITLAFAATSAVAEEGVGDNTVRFAQVAALDGPASALDLGMRAGLVAAFEEANRNGGVHGRKIELESTNVVNVRATYDAETEAWIAHLVDELGMTDIAILYQDDGYGRVGLAGVEAGLERRGMEVTAEGTYTRNTVAVKTALLDIRKAEPQAVVIVGAYKPVAEFIKLARKLDFAPTFVNISFVGSDALAQELGSDGQGVIISQVVPFPWDATVPIVAEYQAAMTAADPEAKPGFVSLEGYITGRVAIEALEKAGGELTREGFLAALADLGTFDLGGVTMAYGAGDNQGSADVFMTRITADGTFEQVDAAAPGFGG